MIVALFLGVILGTGLTIFTLENAGLATISILSWQLTAPLASVLIGIMGAGIVATLLALIPAFLRYEKRVRKLESDKRALQDELAKYSITIPIAPPEATPAGLPVWPVGRSVAEARA